MHALARVARGLSCLHGIYINAYARRRIESHECGSIALYFISRVFARKTFPFCLTVLLLLTK